MSKLFDEKEINNIIKKSVKESFRANGIYTGPTKKETWSITESKNISSVGGKVNDNKVVVEGSGKMKGQEGNTKMGNITKETIREMVMEKAKPFLDTVKEKLHEGFVLTPKSFLLKTEFLSSKAKEAHEKLYNNYVKSFDKTTVKAATVSTEESSSNNSEFRSYKTDEQYNLNAIKLHELYFNNISDINSSISVDSVPYMRLARDFGTFEKWQFDFRACCVASREGWAIVYYEPMRKVYMNCIVDGHSVGIPVGGIPVLVIDMWSHAYYRDYVEDKKSYANAMMKEINWNVVEARMVIAERSRLGDIYDIRPLVNEIPQKMIDGLEQGQAPIGNEQIETSDINVPEQPIGGAKGSI